MEIATFAPNMGAALLMGMAIGLERQFRQHTAGLRTNALICLGAALFVSVARMIDHESSPTRIAAQVVSGIQSRKEHRGVCWRGGRRWPPAGRLSRPPRISNQETFSADSPP